jgi:hypothetical protein
MPRLVEERYGPALVKGEQRGVYEFADLYFEPTSGFASSTRAQRFIDAAREHGADETKAGADRAFRKVAVPQKQRKD